MAGANWIFKKKRKGERKNKETVIVRSSSPDHLYDTIPDDIFLEYAEGASTTSHRENRTLRDIKTYWFGKERTEEDLQAIDNESVYADRPDDVFEDNPYEWRVSADQRRCMEYEEMVKVFRPLIVKKVMLHQLLPHLTFVDDVKHRYNISNKSPEEAMGELLEECIRAHEPVIWSIFMSALENCGYSFVVQNIKGYRVIDSSYQEKYLNILKPKLQYMIEVEEVLPYLISKNTITDEDKQEIEATEQNKGTIIAASMLLDRVARKQEFWYLQLLSSFREIGRQDIADYLDIPEMMLPSTASTLKMDDRYREDYMNTIGLSKIGIKNNCSHRGTYASSNADVSLGKVITEDYSLTELTPDEQAPPIPARFSFKPDDKSPLKVTKSLEKRLDELKLKNEELKKQQKCLNEIAMLEQSNYEILKKHAKHERTILNTHKQLEQLHEASLSEDNDDDKDDDEEQVGIYEDIVEDDEILDTIPDLK